MLGKLRGSAGNSKGRCSATPHKPPVAANRRTGPGRRGPAQKLPPACWQRGKKQENLPLAAKAPAEHARGAGTGTTAATAAGGDGRQPRREHRHRRQPTTPTNTQEGERPSPRPATSPTTPAISLLPTVQQRGSVRHLQSPRHHTISWNVSLDLWGLWARFDGSRAASRLQGTNRPPAWFQYPCDRSGVSTGTLPTPPFPDPCGGLGTRPRGQLELSH